MTFRTYNFSRWGLCLGLLLLAVIFLADNKTSRTLELATRATVPNCNCVCEAKTCPTCPTLADLAPRESDSGVNNLLDNPMMNNLAVFNAGSANDGNYKHLWIEGAGLFIPLMNELLGKMTAYEPTWRTCEDYNKNDAFTEKLANTFNSHGSDKATSHDYYKAYGAILQELGPDNPLTLLEVGMGTNNSSVISSMGTRGKPGVSLRTFRDVLPRTKVYGADIDKDILFTENRIETFQVNQMKRSSFAQLGADNRMFDLVIDDGLHSTVANLNTLLWAMEHTNKGGYVVIEDIAVGHIDNWRVVDFILSRAEGWEGQLVDCKLSNLFILQRLH